MQHVWKGKINNDELILRRLNPSTNVFEGSLYTKLKEKGKHFIGRYLIIIFKLH